MILLPQKKRGVKVVIEDAKLGESLSAYNKLKESNVDVKTDFPGKRSLRPLSQEEKKP